MYVKCFCTTSPGLRTRISVDYSFSRHYETRTWSKQTPHALQCYHRYCSQRQLIIFQQHVRKLYHLGNYSYTSYYKLHPSLLGQALPFLTTSDPRACVCSVSFLLQASKQINPPLFASSPRQNSIDGRGTVLYSRLYLIAPPHHPKTRPLHTLTACLLYTSPSPRDS